MSYRVKDNLSLEGASLDPKLPDASIQSNPKFWKTKIRGFARISKELHEFLNKEIANAQIAKCITLSKNGKSAPEDTIFNELLKQKYY